MKTFIQSLAEDLFEKTRETRRYLHSHPELSYQEKETSAYIASRLKEIGIPHQTGVGGHGVVGLIEGGKGPGRILALRADMDALPIEETATHAYCSERPGVMHACGHDVHTAILLSVSELLWKIRDDFAGTVKLIFQPAEEKMPGGASLMIADGVLQNPAPEAILGEHVHPELDAGMVGFRPGMFMASADELYLSVRGKGGHAAMPHTLVDTVYIASQIINGMQQLVSRRANPIIPTVLSFGKIWSEGGATNVIPDEVRIEGTLRTMDKAWREEAHALLHELCRDIAKAFGGSCELKIVKGYPPLVNDEELTRFCMEQSKRFLGEDKVVELPMRMGAEDFAYYAQELPACFYRLGTGGPEGRFRSPLHTSTFDINEQSLLTGVGLMAWLGFCELTVDG